MDAVERVPSGWCACWQRCGGVGVECVRVPGRGEYCLACAADLDPPGGPAGGGGEPGEGRG